jgi:hypothetical protein
MVANTSRLLCDYASTLMLLVTSLRFILFGFRTVLLACDRIRINSTFMRHKLCMLHHRAHLYRAVPQCWYLDVLDHWSSRPAPTVLRSSCTQCTYLQIARFWSLSNWASKLISCRLAWFWASRVTDWSAHRNKELFSCEDRTFRWNLWLIASC